MALRSRVPLLGNRFREEGATALGKAIKMNSTLTELEIGHEVCASAATAVAESLKANTSITSIGLMNAIICSELSERLPRGTE